MRRRVRASGGFCRGTAILRTFRRAGFAPICYNRLAATNSGPPAKGAFPEAALHEGLDP